jgi:hypothetical protein
MAELGPSSLSHSLQRPHRVVLFFPELIVEMIDTKLRFVVVTGTGTFPLQLEHTADLVVLDHLDLITQVAVRKSHRTIASFRELFSRGIVTTLLRLQYALLVQ